MGPTRREFIKSVGIAIASLVMARCGCISLGGGGSPRDRLRDCWLKLDWLAQQATGDFDRGERAREQLASRHRAALDDLVAAGELDAAVADYVHEAFSEAAHHIWWSNAPITCYMMVQTFTPASADQLSQQTRLLAEMAESGNVDPVTTAQAQAAIERDIVLLNLSDEEMWALYEEIRQAGGDSFDLPPSDELDLEITPEAAEAARFLVELLLDETP